MVELWSQPSILIFYRKFDFSWPRNQTFLCSLTLSLWLCYLVRPWKVFCSLLIEVCSFKPEFLNPGTVNILGWIMLGGVLSCVLIECLAASLASTHEMPIEHLPQLWQPKCLQTLPSVPCGGGVRTNSPVVESQASALNQHSFVQVHLPPLCSHVLPESLCERRGCI